MPIIHDDEYESSTDSNDSDFMEKCQDNMFFKCPKCDVKRPENEINDTLGICNVCVDELEDD